MNQNYPEWILQKLEEATEDHPYEDPKTLTPVEALDRLLCYEGIIGYTHTILNWIEGIFKIRLDDSDWDDIKKADFIQGFGYFMACNNKRAGCGVNGDGRSRTGYHHVRGRRYSYRQCVRRLFQRRDSRHHEEHRLNT